MKVLQIKGIFDYAALEFERTFDKEEYPDLWKRAKQNKFDRLQIEKTIDEGNMNEHPQEFIIKAYEFEEVDPEFIDFVRDEFINYDSQKHNNFYIIEE